MITKVKKKTYELKNLDSLVDFFVATMPEEIGKNNDLTKFIEMYEREKPMEAWRTLKDLLA